MSDYEHKVMVTQNDDSEYRTGGLRPYLKYKDLGVREATGGQFMAHLIRGNGECPKEGTGRHHHELGFQMNYVLKGWVKMWIEGAGEVRIEEGGCWLQPPAVSHALLDFSEDAEWMEATSPAEFNTVGN